MAQSQITDQTQLSRIVVGLAIGWVFLLTLLFVVFPPQIMSEEGFDSLRFVALVVAVFVPVAMVLLTGAAINTHRKLRDQTFRMQTALDALRQTRTSQPAPQRPVDVKPAARPAPPPEIEPDPPVAPPVAASHLSHIDLIRALNFPDNEDDTEGFAALRAALRDPQARQLVQASQDVLTLLSQDGIYMDDLHVAPASADIWRLFATGERGPAIAGLGGVSDDAALAAVAQRKKEDTIFRDSMLHFLRHFDKMIDAFSPEASDEELLILAETRSARAFMLLGHVSGTFD